MLDKCGECAANHKEGVRKNYLGLNEEGYLRKCYLPLNLKQQNLFSAISEWKKK